MTRLLLLSAVIAAAAAAGGCVADGPGLALSPTMSAQAAPGEMGVTVGAACAAEIAQYSRIVRSDRDTGNLEEKVYAQIDRELARASAACSAGRDREAHAIVAASKARHGYRA